MTEIIAESTEELARSLFASYDVEPVVLRRDKRSVEGPAETRVWGPGVLVSAHVRGHSGTGQPGYRATVHVPFSGDTNLLGLRPTPPPGPPPVGWLNSANSEVQFRFEWPRGDRSPIEGLLGPALDAIEVYLRAQVTTIETFRTDLKTAIQDELIVRRDGFVEATAQIDALKIPVYRNPASPQTYAAPGIERRLPPQGALRAPSQPLEPALVADFYRHIVSVIEAMARGMERNPGDYASWTEEQLRDALLVILNTHYTGRAMGEAFNKSGKTDILVRVEDRNVFIGECKWWSGPKAFAGVDADHPAIEQLLDYATWRDAKLALAIFVRNQDIDATITAAKEALARHPSFLSWTDTEQEGLLRARVRLGEGQDREADLAVIFAHLPRPGAEACSNSAA